MEYKNIIDNPNGGFILLGERYSGVREKALRLAELIANNGENGVSFENHPDIHLIERIPGKRQILLSQIEEIGEFENVYPTYANVNVFVIDDADTLTEEASSRLLKVLEDGANNNCIIMVCSRRPLDTICNRSCIVCIRENDTAYVGEVINRCKGSKTAVMAVSDLGSRTSILKQLEEESGLEWTLKVIDNFLEIKERRELMLVTGALTEDKGFFSSLTKYQLLALVFGLTNVFFDIMYCHTGCECRLLDIQVVERLSSVFPLQSCLEALKALHVAIDDIENSSFTGNDFFLLVKKIID